MKFVAAMLLLCSACVAQTREQAQRSVAPEVLNCPAAQITVEPFKGETRIMTGCGRRKMFTCATLGRNEQCFPMQDLWGRAAFEMGCTEDALKFTPLDEEGHTVGVAGCEKRTTYQYVQVGQWKWDWVPSTVSKNG